MAIVSAIFSLMLLFLVIGTIIVIIFDNGDSAKKIAWILVITILPIIGLLLYFAVGFNLRQSSFSKKKHKKFIDTFSSKADRQVHDLLFGHEKDSLVKTEYKPLTRLLSCDGSTCVTDGNGLEIITSGQRKFELLMKDLENAKEYIHMEYFYFRHDDGAQQIKEMLMKKAREGVKVRFIHENIANIDILPEYYNEMKEAGVMVEKFTKPRWPLINLVTQLNYRDHRKIVVIDGKIGYTGGMNISDDYFVKWRDTHIRVTGNAVAGLQYSFLDTWITAGGKIDDDFAKYFPMCGPQEPVTTINPAGQNATTENATDNEEFHLRLLRSTIGKFRGIKINFPETLPLPSNNPPKRENAEDMEIHLPTPPDSSASSLATTAQISEPQTSKNVNKKYDKVKLIDAPLTSLPLDEALKAYFKEIGLITIRDLVPNLQKSDLASYERLNRDARRHVEGVLKDKGIKLSKK